MRGVWLAATLGACAALAPPRTPSAAIEAYAEALRTKDAAQAHALLTREDARTRSRAELAKALEVHAAEAEELAARLERAERPRVFATVQLDDGSELRLERAAHGGFRVVDPLTRFYAQSSPREALKSFIRAVERQRWDVLLALMPRRERAGLDARQLRESLEPAREELSRLVALLASEQNNPIEVVGDRATMPYGESFTARFLREDGLWKIEDPE